jgi:hypothetical protein
MAAVTVAASASTPLAVSRYSLNVFCTTALTSPSTSTSSSLPSRQAPLYARADSDTLALLAGAGHLLMAAHHQHPDIAYLSDTGALHILCQC